MKKRLISTLLTLCMVLALMPGTAWASTRITTNSQELDHIANSELSGQDNASSAISGKCGDNVTWSYNSGTLTIQGTGSMDNYSSAVQAPWYNYQDEIVTVNFGSGVISIGNYAIYDYYNLTNVTISDSITRIGESAFAHCVNLTRLSIPDSIITIGNRAFFGCFSLTSVTIPNSVTIIGEGAFWWCESLTSVTIPNSITTIGPGAFGKCTNLADVYYGGSESQLQKIISSSFDTDGDGIEEVFYRNVDLDVPTIHYNSIGPDQGTSTPTTPSTPAPVVVQSPQKLAVNGETVNCEKYNIDNSNYFKLRDLAYALNGTGSQFDVGYDAATSTVTITTGKAYTPAGGELDAGVDNSASAQPSGQAILIDGVKHDELTAYNNGGSNFFRLRELGNVLGFEVDYDAATNTAIVRSK